ncbi:hypothetical protein F4859DRAFT_473480 [Xylaria cf. heliscus]|nr:hypothetical protein F4859DRAFT_473480 [Xylaria cf. heliscus]
MAEDHKASPKLHPVVQFDHQIDSQASGIIESNFIAPLEDSQETQGVVSGWHDNDDGHGTGVGNTPLQPAIGPFFSRPKRENPLDFQNGFQYSKAPTLQNLPAQQSAAPKCISRQSGPKNEGVVRTGHQFRSIDRPAIDGLFHDVKDIRAAETQISEAPSNTKENKFDAVSIHRDPHSDSTMSGNDQPEKRDLGATQDDPTQKPPFKNTSPFSKTSAVFQVSKGDIRSPVTKLGGPKLSKSFLDIQRKARIQSTHMYPRSTSQIDKVSPSMFNRRKVPQDATDAPEVLGTRTIFNQTPATPEAQTPTVVQRSQNYRSSTVKMTRPYIQDRGEDYNLHTRPESQASNISRLRAPKIREHKHSPKIQSSRAIQESNTSRHKLAASLNDYFAYENSRKKLWEEKMHHVVEELAERDDRIAEYLVKVQEQDQMIMDLRAANEEQHALHQRQEGALVESEERRQSLRGKMKEYRDHLNDSTKEQQDMFRYFQQRYHGLKDQIGRIEHDRQSLLEKALSTTDEIRDKIRESVEEVRMLSQEEIQKRRLKKFAVASIAKIFQ